MEIGSIQVWFLLVGMISAVSAGALAAYKAITTETKVDEIHTMTNSNFTAQKEEITRLRSELTLLHAELSALKQAAWMAAHTLAVPKLET